jgi:CRISPR-associated protein Cmr3
MTSDAISAVFIEPLDLLVLRGNRLFAGAGVHGEALMPPWPSVAAGSLRSRMLVDAQVSLSSFARGAVTLPGSLGEVLGSPSAPGSFRVRHFGLARRCGAGLEVLHCLPMDLASLEHSLVLVQPRALPPGVLSSYPLASLPMLGATQARKQNRQRWLTPEGFSLWRAGQPVPVRCSVPADELWTLDARLGIATDWRKGTVIDGALYTTEAVAMKPGVGFVAAVHGVGGHLPTNGLLRFGGDGRGAAIEPMCFDLMHQPCAPIEDGRFRLLLTTPGIFPGGWRLPGLCADGTWHFAGGRARLVAASADRLQTLSGWDLARGAPKPAVRAVPAGAVYWFDCLEGDVSALQAHVARGLSLDDPARRAEGFNNCMLAAWPQVRTPDSRPN